jgi:Mn-dependent DtxR family transcriptional regulator
VMLGVHRPTATVVLRTLQRAGLISSRYGRIRVQDMDAMTKRAI